VRLRALALAGAAGAPLLVALDGPAGLRLAFVLVLLLLAPGTAALSVARPASHPEAGLVVGLSLAVAILAGQAMILLDAWSPEAATYLLALACGPPLALALARDLRLRSPA